MAAPQQIEQVRLLSACTSFYAFVAGHGARGDKGLVQSLVETGDDLFQVFALPLDIQWIIGGYNVPPLYGITGVFDNYYGMTTIHKSRNHNTLTYHNDS